LLICKTNKLKWILSAGFSHLFSKKISIGQSLVISVMIDAKFDREDHSSIICNCDREGAKSLKPLDVRADPQTR
jgi:hypothetical protein